MFSRPRPTPTQIEHEMARTQKNKATSGHLGLLKAKIARLRRELLDEGTGRAKGAGGNDAGRGFEVNKVGDSRIGFVGFPSVGKSTLLTKLTGTFSEAADYEFTTLVAVPGTLHYRGARLQLLDLPGIIEGAADGKGRGRQVIATARTCDMILICLDAMKPLTHKRIIERELEGFGIRLNREPPNLEYRKKERGGVGLVNHTKSPLTLDEVKGVLQESRVHNADVIVRGDDVTVDDLVDVVEGGVVYIPAIYVVNKIDQITLGELEVLASLPDHVPVCAFEGWNLDGLVEAIWDRLDLVRVYTRPRGALPDWNDPVVLRRKAATVEGFCNKIHRGILKQLKYALVWGQSARHRGQKVGTTHELMDEDIVQLVKRI